MPRLPVIVGVAVAVAASERSIAARTTLARGVDAAALAALFPEKG